LITVKGNQPKLLTQLSAQFEQLPPQSLDVQTERTRNRVTERRVAVLDQIPELDQAWVGINRIIRIERKGTRGKKPYHEIRFYISSLTCDAAEFAERIRQHWEIENRLHWVKDVVLKEDVMPLCDGHAPVNFSIVRTIALNLFRLNGYDSITRGIRYLGHDIEKLFSFFQ
jgi:predicted transposase YbfD/YdcC